MRLQRIVSLLILHLLAAEGTFSKENTTDYNACEVYYSRFESGYKSFFALSTPSDPSLLVDVHFGVLAVSDAHILLTTSADAKTNDPAYEIVIGAGGNTFSDIRRKQKASVRVSYRKKGLLSAVDVTGFWIHIYTNGLINVGKEGEEVAFMTWTDTELLPVKYWAFAGWGNVELKWFYNCPRPSENGTEITQLSPPTPTEKLREYILNLNESHDDVVKVKIELTSQFVSLDEKQAVLNLKGRANFSWTFNSIKWNPANHSGLKTVFMQHNEIWKPNLYVLNGVDVDHMEPFIGNTLIANYDGKITWQPSFDMLTYCSLSGIEDWPKDVHECEIFLGTSHSENNFVRFLVSAPSETIRLNDKNYDSEWFIEEGPKIHIYQMDNNDNSPDVYIRMPQSLKLRFTIKRRTSLYERAFDASLLMIATMMLVNFWCSPFDYMKISIIATQFVLTTMSLIGLAVVLPAHTEIVPIIVYRYSAMMMANVLNLMISVIVINLARNKQLFEPSHAVGRVVKSALVERLLLLPELTPQTISSPYPAAMETARRRTRVQDVWIRLGMCVDRIAFLVHLAFAISLVCAKRS